MAKKPYDGSLNRHMDFTDCGEQHLPASGLAVQNYIKHIDGTKFGAGMTTQDGSEHLFFRDEGEMQEFIDNPTRRDLILDRIQMEALYTMSAHIDSSTFTAVKLGSSGNYVQYTFETLNKDKQPVPEPVTATYTITRGSTSRKVTENYVSGTVVRFNVDSYLLEGTNSVSVSLRGRLSGASTSFGVTFQVINLELSDNFNISTVNTIEMVGQTIGIPYLVTGTGTKFIEWYIDGEALSYVQSEDEILESSAERTKYINIDSLTQGSHSIQYRARISVQGEVFYSDVLYREIIVSREDSTGSPVAVIAGTVPASMGIVASGQPLTLYPVQYVPIDLKVAAWNPDGTYKNIVRISIDGNEVAAVECTEGEEADVPIIISEYGEKTCTISIGETTRTIGLVISKTTMNIREISSDLLMAFQADGRTNTSANKDQWSSGTYTASFNGFKWTETSGWVDGKLLIPSDASLGFSMIPLGNNPTLVGRTIELEFKTIDVDDENAVLIDLMSIDQNKQVGFKLTATEMEIRSRGGVKVSRRFKTDENMRVSIVINRKEGSTNKCMLFVYLNGILSMVENFAPGDSFESLKPLVIGGHDAGILLKQIRVYNTALSNDGILNNWILYRDSVAEMTRIYEKNDLYEDGTSNFDLNKISKHLPVMILTGDMTPIDEAKDNKATTWMDVEYTNLQNPEYSFKMTHAQMRPQGTSSLTYPRKNLRLYTNKSDDTIVYDSEGQVVADKLYAFKPNAQRVWCWTLKADFAESSSTHNTGVARIWNDVMRDAKIGDNYVLRTAAQQAAKDNGYPYDVRTTVDGFPIVIFWHETPDDPLVFLGKYNFNNDKSTESVFGFVGIPGFDDSSVQCWEFRDSGYDLALFKTPDDETYEEKFDRFSGDYENLFKQVWESRYPDTKTPDYAPIRRLATWINSTENDFEKWVAEKADYFDLPKLAAYYIYLMRFGAVDQTVKNAMMTTEDGLHWYFINYDNDTILGVRNDGLLKFGPEIDRQTPDPELGGYAYAGHDSVLWNNFESDEECMALVKTIDSALYSAGLTYNNMIKMFNDEQAGKWSERIYNEDAQYKYISPFVNKSLNYLGSLQGSRSDHRKWWISNRFADLDAKYGNAAYTSNTASFLIPGAPAGSSFSIKAGKDFYYGYGQNRQPVEIGVHLDRGDTSTFVLNMNFEIGTPIQIYAPQYIDTLDISGLMKYVGSQNFDLSKAYSDTLGSKMKRLIMGGNTGVDSSRNYALSDISSISGIKTLEELNIEGYTAITYVNLSTLTNLKTFKAKYSGLTEVTFAQGSPLFRIELPSSLQQFEIKDLVEILSDNIIIDENGKNLFNVNIRNCKGISGSIDFILNWLANKTASDNECSLYIDNVMWKNLDAQDLITVANFKKNGGNVTLKGEAYLTTTTQEDVQALIDGFGQSAFKKGSEFFISAPDAIYITGRQELLEGESEQYIPVVFSENPGKVTFSIINGGTNWISLDTSTGLLTTSEYGSSATITIRALHKPTSGRSVYTDFTVEINKRKYPKENEISLSGSGKITQNGEEYKITFQTSGINGSMYTVWTLSGDVTQYSEIDSSDNTHCVLKQTVEMTDLVKEGVLTAVLKKSANNSTIATKTYNVAVVNDTIAISATVNPYAMALMYSKGFASNPEYMTKDEAANVYELDLQSGTSGSSSIFYADNNFRSGCKNFDEFQYFTSLTSIPVYLFYQCRFESIVLPPHIDTIEDYGFAYISQLKNIGFSDDLKSIGYYAFYNSGLRTLTLPNGVTQVKNAAFGYSTWLKTAILPNTLVSIPDSMFQSCTNLESVTFGENLTNIGNSAFYSCSNLETVDFPQSLTTIGSSAFADTKIKNISIGKNVTTIGNSAFNKCNIESISIDDENGSFYGNDCIIARTNDELIVASNTLTEIPSTVKIIGNGVFRGSKITNIIVPQGATTISAFAFSDSSLSYINLPDTITSIGNNAFQNCKELVSFSFPDLVSSANSSVLDGCISLQSVNLNKISSIYSYAFGGCESLLSIHIPSTLTYLDTNNPFSNLNSLEQITVDSSNQRFYSLGNCLIYKYSDTEHRIRLGCKNSVIPDNLSVKLTISGKFYGMDNIPSGFFPENIETLSGFEGVTTLTTATIDSSNNNAIAKSTCSSCSNLTTVYIDVPEMSEVCRYCSNLTTVTFGNKVKKIGFCSFQSCSNLTTITFPESIERIESSAFNSCRSLTTITCLAQTPPLLDSTESIGGTLYIKHIYVPSESVELYKSASVWSSFSDKIEAITTL